MNNEQPNNLNNFIDSKLAPEFDVTSNTSDFSIDLTSNSSGTYIF
jgi:hypothetical protein